MASEACRVIRHVEDGGGLRAALVPLGRASSKGVAIIEEEDLALLQELGLSLAWNRNPTTGVVVAPAGAASGNRVQVARVLLDLGPGENVRYLSGDPTDLRRSNLEVNPEGWAIRRDRDFITPKGKSRQWGAIAHEWSYQVEEEENSR